MDDETIALLTQIITRGQSTYSDTAQAVLDGTLVLSPHEITQLYDAFLHDPYLTKNS